MKEAINIENLTADEVREFNIDLEKFERQNAYQSKNTLSNFNVRCGDRLTIKPEKEGRIVVIGLKNGLATIEENVGQPCVGSVVLINRLD